MPIEVTPIDTAASTTPIVDTIEAAVTQPLSVSVDGQSVSNHSLTDLIEVDRYLKSRLAIRVGWGVRYVKFVPPGA